MGNELALTINQRTALSSIKSIDHYLTRTERRLSTGKRISSVVDGPMEYFFGRELSTRATKYLGYIREQEQSVQALEATIEALETIDNLLVHSLGIVNGARHQTDAQRKQASSSLAETLRQINLTLTDPSYLGINLLEDQNSILRIRLSDERVRVGATDIDAGLMNITAYNLRDDATGLLGAQSGYLSLENLDPVRAKYANDVIPMFQGAVWQPIAGTEFRGLTQMADDNNAEDFYTAYEALVRDARDQIESISIGFGNSLALLNERIAFSRVYSDTIQIGSDKIVLADMNEEGANLTALRARNQISIETLSIASQQLAAVLTLLQ